MTTPDYFSPSFWRTTLNHIIFGAATNAMTAWALGTAGANDAGSHLSVPGVAVALAALSGAIFAFLLSLVGQALPGTGTGSFVPPVGPRARRAARKAAAKAPARKAPPAKRAPGAKPPPPAAGK